MNEIVTLPAFANMADQVEMEYHMPLLEEYASRSNVIVELGCGHGNGSTRALARGISRSPGSLNVFVTVDADPDRPQIRPNLPYWHLVHGLTQYRDTMERVKAILGFRRADLIFIDTDHTKEQMAAELEIWQEIAYPTCTWLFHDTHMWGDYNPMTDAIKEFAVSHGQMYTDLTLNSHGLGQMRPR